MQRALGATARAHPGPTARARCRVGVAFAFAVTIVNDKRQMHPQALRGGVRRQHLHVAYPGPGARRPCGGVNADVLCGGCVGLRPQPREHACHWRKNLLRCFVANHHVNVTKTGHDPGAALAASIERMLHALRHVWEQARRFGGTAPRA